MSGLNLSASCNWMESKSLFPEVLHLLICTIVMKKWLENGDSLRVPKSKYLIEGVSS